MIQLPETLLVIGVMRNPSQVEMFWNIWHVWAFRNRSVIIGRKSLYVTERLETILLLVKVSFSTKCTLVTYTRPWKTHQSEGQQPVYGVHDHVPVWWYLGEKGGLRDSKPYIFKSSVITVHCSERSETWFNTAKPHDDNSHTTID